jgi:hypothetical protein
MLSMSARMRIGAWITSVAMLPRLVQAEPSAGDKATAQALFDQGKQLAAAGKVNEACPKFEESERLDPGIGTQFHLASCYEQAGRTASAWTLFIDVASAAHAQKQLEREKVARGRAAVLEPRLSRITIEVPDRNRLTDLEVRRDGVSVGRAQWGAPLPVDPGDHTITASATHKRAWQTTVRLTKGGGAMTVTVPALEDAPASAAVGPPVAATEAPFRASVPPSEGQASGRRTLGLAIASTGAAAAVTGVVLGLLAKSKFDSASEGGRCDATGCDPEARSIQRTAMSRGNVATVVFVAGAAIAGAGAVIWLTAPRAEATAERQLNVGFSPSGLLVRGSF